ncbi:MAG: TRAP transporter large permease subunit [Burkholderiales bacterium]|nr:TRAP transporter large permease subunit [Burkholderiales bacterium]
MRIPTLPIRHITTALEWLCIALFATTVALTVVQVFFRYVLNNALFWSEEVARFCFVWSVFLGTAVVAGRGRHMRMELFSAITSGPRRLALDLLAETVTAAAAIAMLLHGWSFATQVTGVSGALEWPSRWLYMAVPCGGALTLLFVLTRRPLGAERWWAGLCAAALGALFYKALLSGEPWVSHQWSVGWSLHIAALGLMFLDAPIAFCMIVGTYLAFANQGPLMLLPISQSLASSVNSFVLLSIPFFILAAHVMNSSGITAYLVRFAAALVGHMRGGLAQVNVVTNVVMGGLSGSSLAVAVGTAKALVPEMEKRGYPKPFAAAVTSSASTMDNLIPPSIGMIVYAALGSVSVGALFTAGIVPGLLMALALMAVVRWQAVRRNFEPASRPATLAERGQALWAAVPALLVPILIIGGMRAGAFTASEAGAMAVVYALVIGKLAYRQFRWREAPGILKEGFVDTVIIIAVVAAAAPFGWALGIERIPQKIAEQMGALAQNKWIFLLLLNGFLLVVGLAMEFLASLVILVPILLPLAVKAGIDPVHLGVIMVMNLVLGALTPPLGVLVFATASIAQVRINAVYREVLPFFCALTAVLVLVTYWPWLSLGLPKLIGY